MNIDLKNLVSITEANQNFSKVARMAEENGTVVILKNNSPKYVLIDYERLQELLNSEDISAEKAAVQYLNGIKEDKVISYHLVWALESMAAELQARGLHKALFCYPEQLHKQTEYPIKFFDHFFNSSKILSVSSYHLEKAIDALKRKGIDYQIFNCGAVISIDNIHLGVKAYQEAGSDCIIVFDSVYSLDMAKAISLKLNNPGFTNIKQIPDILSTEEAGAPIFVIPIWTRRI